MSILDDPNMIRAIISDHYAHPRNKVEEDPIGYESMHMDSDSCVDDFYVFLKVENNIIVDCKYKGVGCTISTASLSIISELVIGKSKEEALEIISSYYHMLHHDEEYDEDKLEELTVFSNTYKQANRIKCAYIGANGIEKILKKEEK